MINNAASILRQAADCLNDAGFSAPASRVRRIAQDLETAPISRLASETIWSNGKVIIPMCDVQHIENRTRQQYVSGSGVNTVNETITGIAVVMKSTRRDPESDEWDNGIWIWGEDAKTFIADYCTFRGEIDPVMDLRPDK